MSHCTHRYNISNIVLICIYVCILYVEEWLKNWRIASTLYSIGIAEVLGDNDYGSAVCM